MRGTELRHTSEILDRLGRRARRSLQCRARSACSPRIIVVKSLRSPAGADLTKHPAPLVYSATFAGFREGSMRISDWAQKFNLAVKRCEERPDQPQGDIV